MRSDTTTALPGLARCALLMASADRWAVADAGAQLASAVTQDDWPAAEAVPLARNLIAILDRASEPGQARAVLLLGILAEKGPAVRDAAREGLGCYLHLLASAASDGPLYLGLLYLLAHFPEDGEHIMAVAGHHSARDPHGISRLERTLQKPGASDPETIDGAGRSWPSPTLLAITEDELAATAAERRARPGEQILASWEADTAALLAYAGGLAAARGA
jgi:hypothetical protein